MSFKLAGFLSSLRNISEIIRGSEWWEYKIPPILSVMYLLVISPVSPDKNVYLLSAFILVSLAAGAIYVSIINDITDVSEDQAAGKSNRVASLSKTGRVCLLSFSIILIAIPLYILRHYPLAAFFYFLSCLSFTFYSVPPFRLKQKVLWGIIADAGGSQCFPTLYTAVLSSEYLSVPVSPVIIVFIGVWSMCYGIRGILWHQFSDMEFDRRSRLITLPQLMSNSQVRLMAWSIIIPEIGALVSLFIYLKINTLPVVFLLYLLYILFLHRKGIRIILVRHLKQPHNIFLSEFYQTVLPVTLLALCVMRSSELLPLALIHFLLFMSGIKRFAAGIFLR